jgi:hypothetical protein
VLLRRPLREKDAAAAAEKERKSARQLSLDLPEATYQGVRYEYGVLVTSMQYEVRTKAQLYRDRGDSENNFDGLTNQWAWTGFTTRLTADLQLVDGLHATGNTGQARRSDHFAPAGAAWNRTADMARQSNHRGNHQHACNGASHSGGADEDQCLF